VSKLRLAVNFFVSIFIDMKHFAMRFSFSFGCYLYVTVNDFILLVIFWIQIWLFHFGCVWRLL